MSRTVRARLLLAAFLGTMAGSATAAERIVVVPAKPKTAPPAAIVPVGDHEEAPPPKEPRPLPQPGPGYYPRVPAGARELPPGYPPVNSDHSQRPFRDWLYYGRPLGCWGSFNNYGCGSLHSHLEFIFGSCRQFYGEPCLKGAPPSPMPPWAGPESGYHGDKPLPNEAGREWGYHLRNVLKRGGGCPSCQ